MFDDLIKELERLNEMTISVHVEADEKGYIDKQCPSEECRFIFKINEEDWKTKVSDAAVWCPLCRYEAVAEQWFTDEQNKHAEKEALAVINGKINNAMRRDASEFNRRQPRDGFLNISMNVQGGSKRTYAIPAKAAEVMQLEITCEKCNSRFAIIGSAFFCPACGHNSVTQTFSDSLRKIKAKRDNIETIKQAVTESAGKDEAELTCRSLRETCISDGVSAFQKYCEGMYAPYGEIPFNVFQRLDAGSDLWLKTIQRDYNAWLTDNELDALNLLFQKRHILIHNEGIVDEQYVKKSVDITYKVGQRIVITNNDIDNLINHLEKLGNGLKDACT